MALPPKKKIGELRPEEVRTETESVSIPETPATVEAEQIRAGGFDIETSSTPKEAIAEAIPLAPRGIVTPQVKKEPLLHEIENVLADGLFDLYRALPADVQRDFKTAGERTALHIQEMVKKAHIKVRKILSLIRQWLKIIPGVNKFFLEQEAKIKTDKIIELAKRK